MCEDKTKGMSRPGAAVSRSGRGGWDAAEVSAAARGAAMGLSLALSPLADLIRVVRAEQKHPLGGV